MLIASLGGIYLPHLRHRNWSKAAFNACGMGIAAWSSAALAWAASPIEGSALGTLFVVTATIGIYWVINNLIVAGHQVTVGGRRYGLAAHVLICSDTDVLAWTGAACLGAVAAGSSTAAGIAFIGAIVGCRVASISPLFARLRGSRTFGVPADALAIWLAAIALAMSNGGMSPLAIALGISVSIALPRHLGHPNRLVATGLPLIALATLGSPPAAAAAVVVGTLVIFVRTWKSPASWTASLALGTAAFSLTGPSAFEITHAAMIERIIAAVVIPPLIAAVLYASRSWLSSTSIGLWVTLGIIAPDRHEIAGLTVAVALALMARSQAAFALSAATVLIVLRCATASTDLRSSAAASR
jgi:hypothetical protein